MLANLTKFVISIHAPRGGSDQRRRGHRTEHEDFNPRSPWGERPTPITDSFSRRSFQSTLPVGGATGCPVRMPARPKNFNPRSPWGERLGSGWTAAANGAFQSTLPVGGATGDWRRPGGILRISIHAPRGGSDPDGEMTHAKNGYFNPRSPWGERLAFSSDRPLTVHNFNPRSPWGERRRENRCQL